MLLPFVQLDSAGYMNGYRGDLNVIGGVCK